MLNQKKPFLTNPGPTDYVAGIGRGAVGFTTRSDIGPAREISFGKAPIGYVPGQGRGARGFSKVEDDDSEMVSDNHKMLDDEGESLLFGDSEYDADDKEADDVWDAIDKRMASKRKRQKELRERMEIERYRAKNPKIQTQFADIKKELSKITEEEWSQIPEIGDRSLKYKKPKYERYTPAPDSLLELAIQESKLVGTITPFVDGETSGISTVVPTSISNFKALEDARKTAFGSKLKDVEISGDKTSIDTEGYLTELSSKKVFTQTEIGDYKRTRSLFKAATQSNPTYAPAWINRAKLEEAWGKLIKAQKIIEQGCINCPKNQDVWLEAARLNSPENAKAILARAVKHLPKSYELWIAAARLEKDKDRKRRVLRKALENIPNSVNLWKEAIKLEEPEEAKILLKRAVQCVPHSTQMWLALAKLEDYNNAKDVLNKARKKIPTDRSIWIAACQLEEANGNEKGVRIVIKNAIKSLNANGANVDRETWIKEAQRCEEANSPLTCQAIIMETLGMGLEEEDWKSTWIEDAEESIKSGHIHTARAIYAKATSTFPQKKGLWKRLFMLEKKQQSKENIESVLKEAVKHCPKADELWLMYAKEKWLEGKVDEAREIIKTASDENPNSEDIWLAAAKLERETGEFERARALLERARKNVGTAKIWMKSALLERQLGNIEGERTLLDEGLDKFKTFDKLWMMKGQLETRLENFSAAREVYIEGLKHCINSIPLWLCAIRLEEKIGGYPKARVMCEKARLKNPKNPQLWLEAVRIEVRGDQKKIAQNLLSRALQYECPDSGILWAEQIELASKHEKRARTLDALNKCNNDPIVLLAVAKLFWQERRIPKAREWFERAINADPDIGDIWANYYKFEIQHGTEEQAEGVKKRCIEAEPRYGEKWISVSKAIENYNLTTEQILKKTVLIV